MYEDSWYSFVPEISHKKNVSISQTAVHRRRESLLQQPNGTNQTETIGPLEGLLEEAEISDDPPEPILSRRVKSYSDFYHVVRSQLSKDASKKQKRQKKDKSLEAILLEKPDNNTSGKHGSFQDDSFHDELLEASQQEFLLYREQLAMTERHLGALIDDTDDALKLLETLATSFRSVDIQTSSFQAQCDDLISEETRLQKLADEVGTDLHYYAYLDGVTRRLNAPGASRLVDHENFAEILTNTDACIGFMAKHPTHRDAESYLARYQSSLAKALHLLESGFTSHLETVSSEISKQISSTQSEAARHALAYGRFQELVLDADGLVGNVQKVIRSCYDQLGNPVDGQNFDYYSNTSINIFSSYSDVRDRDLRPITQHDLETFKREAKEANAQTASRNFIKQCYERSFNEFGLFAQIFSIEPQFSMDGKSAYAALRTQQKALVSVANVAPIANTLYPVLQLSDLRTICNIVGWITNEYLLLEYDEEESRYTQHCQQLSARLLLEHLWPLTDKAFENEITKSISKHPLSPETLKIGPVVNGVASSNAHPITKRALELLGMYDQAMPKERSQKSSPVIFRIVHETILALQRAEARLKAIKSANPDPDPDLFMIKNLLILKNELVSLEIGDIRSETAAMQHFGQIWDTLSPQNWMGLFRGILGGSLSLGLWSSAANNTAANGKTAPAKDVVRDASEKLDELLRQNIYAFTQRWGALINAARSGKKGAKSLGTVEKELDVRLLAAFGGQPEVLGKLKEAIQINAQAQKELGGTRGSR
ncbi:Sec34-like family-domain-containing protein [Pseudomassariella vexata]|uniref:Conserved oligomeric Golgi complex subunit 3 n=1 Tax=Pseudomassariella vexata TaxID=1141098 RepID=A0A1Y2E6P1_9PEZI|nr:Sec34-like family-domain-containing protein [Pseudomassariella vexata]ORY67228.1 Sec34-like family-domain-containing protein [Pseudomassariella vexata]